MQAVVDSSKQEAFRFCVGWALVGRFESNQAIHRFDEQGCDKLSCLHDDLSLGIALFSAALLCMLIHKDFC